MLTFILSLLEDDGQKEIIARLYEEHKKMMKHVAWQILQQEDLSEDAVHDAFVKTIPILERVKDPQSQRAKALLVIAVKNVARGMLRKSLNGEAAMEKVDFDSRKEDFSAEAVLLDRLSVEEILACLQSLEEPHREILLLKVRQDASDAELAAVLGLSPMAYRKRLHRARQALIDVMNRN